MSMITNVLSNGKTADLNGFVVKREEIYEILKGIEDELRRFKEVLIAFEMIKKMMAI